MALFIDFKIEKKNLSIPILYHTQSRKNNNTQVDHEESKGPSLLNYLAKEKRNNINILKTEREIQNQKEAKEMNLPRINVEAIEFGWIHNTKEGVNFLKELAQSDSVEIFDLKIIRIIIIYLWSNYNKILNLLILYPFYAFLVLYILYATWIHKKKFEEN